MRYNGNFTFNFHIINIEPFNLDGVRISMMILVWEQILWHNSDLNTISCSQLIINSITIANFILMKYIFVYIIKLHYTQCSITIQYRISAIQSIDAFLIFSVNITYVYARWISKHEGDIASICRLKAQKNLDKHCN